MSITDDIAEMICIAYGERYDSKSTHEQHQIQTWANSILNHVINNQKRGGIT